MNFRTTIFLLVLLVAAATVYFITTRAGDGDGRDTARTTKADDDADRKLLEVPTSDVKRIVVTPAEGDRLVFERVEGKPSDWRIVEPVRAPADGFKVDDLVREVTELRSRGQVEPGDKGVDQPQYTIELTHGPNSETTVVKVGNRSPVGDMLYVRLADEQKADVVSASIIDQLEKQGADYRRVRLLDVSNDRINSLAIAEGDKTLRLEKSAADDKWRIVEPKEMPGDDAQVSALLTAVTGLDAVKFVAEDAGNAAAYGLARPTMTVTFTTEPPAQPSTGPAATKPATGPSAADTTTIRFGRPDVQKQNVYAMVSESGPIVTVANADLEGLKKSPLDLRDREVLDLEADSVSRITLSIDRAATTQPTSQPAEKRELVLERRSEVLEVGPPAPDAPASAPAAPDGGAPAEQKEGEAPQPDGAAVPAPAEPAPPPAEPKDDAPNGDAPAQPDAPGAPDGEPQPESQPQSKVTSPAGGAVITLAAFQDSPAPAEPKPEEPKPDEPNPEEPDPEEPNPEEPKPADAAGPDEAPAPPAAKASAPPADDAAAEGEPSADAPSPDVSATGPATAPTTEPAATQPAAPKSKWLIASEPRGDANDAHVRALIDALRPLRAQKFLESFPTTQATPVATYVLTVSTRAWGDEPAKEHEIRITDPGGQANPIAQVGDLVFEIDRTFLDKLTADFTEPNLPEPPGFPEGAGDPADLLRQFGGGGGPPGR